LVCQKDEVIKIDDAVFGIKDLAICSVRLEGEQFDPSKICDESLETTRIIKQLYVLIKKEKKNV
jgi:hypothetical protein